MKKAVKKGIFTILIFSFILLSFGLVRAENIGGSHIIVHALNPEGVEIASIEGMDPYCVEIYDGDTLIGYGAHNEETYNKPIAISPGNHTIRVIFNGMTLEQNINIQEGQTKQLIFIFKRVKHDITWSIDESIDGSVSWSHININDDPQDVKKTSGGSVYNTEFSAGILSWCNCCDHEPWLSAQIEGRASFHLHNTYCSGSSSISGSASGAYCDLYAYVGVFPMGAGACSGVYPIDIPDREDFIYWYSQYILDGCYPSASFSTTSEFNTGGYSSYFIKSIGTEPYKGETGYHLIWVPANIHYKGIIFIMRNTPRSVIFLGDCWEDFSSSDSDSYSIEGSLSYFKFSSVPYDILGTGIKYKEYVEPPVASFTYSPENPNVGEEITFDASSSYDTDGTIVKYEWDFGDGNRAEGEVVTHAYSEAGEYTVTLRVMDNDGLQNSISKVFEVKPIPVLLVYGWHGSPKNWDLIKSWLEEDGYIIEILNYDYSHHAYVVAGTLSKKVKEMLEKYDVEKIDIIAHSFGGLVSRYYIERMGGDEKARNLIMIATPNHGSRLADYLTGELDDKKGKNIVEFVVESYAMFRPDRKWGSSLDLRTKNNDFLDMLNLGFNPDKLSTKYFVIAGTGHYPKKYSSHRMFLPGHDDGVVTVESARLKDVPLYCVNLDHSSIVNPDQVRDRKLEEKQSRERRLRYMYEHIIKSILQGFPPSPSTCPCPKGKDLDDNQWLPDIATDFTIRLRLGDSTVGTFGVSSNSVRVEVGITFPLCEFDFTLISPTGRKITPDVASQDPNIDYVENDSYWYYSIKNPEPGEWKYNITAIEVPEEGVNVTIFVIADVVGCYIGAYLGCGPDDSSCESIQEFNQRMGKPHAIFVRYVDIKDSKNPAHWEWAEEVKRNGAMPMSIYDPWDGLDAIDMADVEYFASKCKELNVPVFVVFGHEMNLPFYPWGNQPEKYKEKFKEVAEAFHKIAPNVEMCWVPNQNWGYPWGGTDYGDGYSEYYPEGIGTYGEYVDWVGLDFYEKDWDQDNLVPQDMFISNIRNGQDGIDFYEIFAVEKNKPMLIAETGAFDPNKDPTAPGERNPLNEAEEVEFKNEWIKQVYNVSTLKEEFPRLNAICYFHVNKTETIDTKSHSFHDIVANYTIPESPNVYKDLIADPYFVTAGIHADLYTLNITKSGTGSGTVASNPTGINCGSECTETYASGATVTLTATPDQGSSFPGWTGDCSACGQSKTCVITMDSDKTCTARFEQVNQPPVIESFTVNSTSGNIPLAIMFTCIAHDPDGSVAKYKWDFGDGNTAETTTGTTTHTYNTAGTYNAKVTVVDNGGAEISSTLVLALVLPGDVNSDGNIDLGDAILALQAVSDLTAQDIYQAADVNGDGRIGIQEAIYIMQKVSGPR